MSEKKAEKSENSPKIPDAVLESPDAHGAKNSGKAEITSVEKLRTNQSDGSLRRFSGIDLSDQDQSIEITYCEKSASRTNKLTEAELLKNERQAAIDAQSGTIEEMRHAVKTTPALEPILALREHAEGLPPGQDRDKFRDLANSQAKELSPDMAAYLNARDHGTSSAGVGDVLKGKVTENHLGSDLEQAFGELGKLPLDKQISVLSAGFMAGYEQYQNDERDRTWGRMIGAVEGLGSALTGVATVVDFGGAVIWNNKEVAGEIAEQFGTALGTVTFSGIRIFAASDKCLYDTGASGDYSLPFRQIAAAGGALNEQWANLPPKEQERIKYRLITEFAADALMSAGCAQAVGKAKTFTDVLDALAVNAVESGVGTFNRSKKALSASIQEFFTPEYSYAGIGKLKVLQQPAEDLTDALFLERRAYVSKLDSTHRLKPIEAARENARLRGGALDEEAWKKLTPQQKQDALVKDGYEVLVDPEPRQLIDSTELATVFRGDRSHYSQFDRYGLKKSYLNESGDLVPANPDGMLGSEKVEVIDHIVEEDTLLKANSPYTSVGTSGVVFKYGDGKGLAVDVAGLRQAIKSGEVKDVEILEHDQVIKAIENSGRRAHAIKMALRFVKKDNEFLIKGVVPNRFLRVIAEE